MAEDPVSKEQHRADMAELKSELKEELAGVRQEIAVLAKTMEAHQQATTLRFDQVDQRFEQVQNQMTADREAMLLRFEQADQRHNDLVTKMDQRHMDLLTAMNQRFDQVNERFSDLRAETRDIRADMRQTRTWLIALYGLVVFGFLGTIFITIFKDKLFS